LLKVQTRTAVSPCSVLIERRKRLRSTQHSAQTNIQ
jgi:hypothetical protein